MIDKAMNDFLPAFIFFGSGLMLLLIGVWAIGCLGIKLYDFVMWLRR